MITVKEVQIFHEILIEKFGGTKGVRDIGLLESALARPFQKFEKNELYPTIIHKAAAIIESIIVNHPFIDGNKRTGYVIMRLLLLDEGLDIESEEKDKYDFVIGIASGRLNFDSIFDWINKHLRRNNRP